MDFPHVFITSLRQGKRAVGMEALGFDFQATSIQDPIIKYWTPAVSKEEFLIFQLFSSTSPSRNGLGNKSGHF